MCLVTEHFDFLGNCFFKRFKKGWDTVYKPVFSTACDNDNNILIIIERKKYADLSASIKDGRYKEQKERLMHSTSYKVRKIYLLEGNNIKDFQFSLKTFESIIINTMIRDEIFIFNSKCINVAIKKNSSKKS